MNTRSVIGLHRAGQGFSYPGGKIPSPLLTPARFQLNSFGGPFSLYLPQISQLHVPLTIHDTGGYCGEFPVTLIDQNGHWIQNPWGPGGAMQFGDGASNLTSLVFDQPGGYITLAMVVDLNNINGLPPNGGQFWAVIGSS